jgi:hypothetical protein
MEPTLHLQEEPILNIAGEKVALGPLRRDLIPLYLKWDNDFAVLAPRGMPLRPKTWEAEETWYEGAGKREGEVLFTVCCSYRRLPDDLHPTSKTEWPWLETSHGAHDKERPTRKAPEESLSHAAMR